MEKKYDLTTRQGILEYFESEDITLGYVSDVYPELSEEFRDDYEILLAALEGTGYWAEDIVSHASERLQKDPEIQKAVKFELDREYRENNGYDRDGYDRDGFNVDGYDRDGFDADGYDWRNFNKEGINKDTGTIYDKNGFDVNGIHENGTEFDEEGFDFEGFDEEGFDKFEYDRDGYNRDETEICLDGMEFMTIFNRNGRIYDTMDYVTIRDLETGEERRVSTQELEKKKIVEIVAQIDGKRTTIEKQKETIEKQKAITPTIGE